MITRRGLLQGILAAGIAPAFGRAGIIMPPRHVIAPRQEIVITGTTLVYDFVEWHRRQIEIAVYFSAFPPLVYQPYGRIEEFQLSRLKGHA